MMLGVKLFIDHFKDCLSRCHVLVAAQACPLERTLGKRDNHEMAPTFNFAREKSGMTVQR